jgi:geranylgeranyl reductase family protein
MNRHFDAVVVGGGPAGAAAAITLARAGDSVILVDRARFPRDKCCGDGLTAGALRRLELLGLDPAAVRSFTSIDELAVRSPSGRVLRVPLGDGPGIFGAIARRADLDAALVQRAASDGVEVRDGDGVVGLEIGADGVTAQLGSGTTIAAKFCVAADGAWSPVRRLLEGADPPPAAGSGDAGPRRPAAPVSWLAYRAYARGVTGDAAERPWVSFSEALLPGYAWSFPIAGGVVNFGVGLPRPEGTSGRSLRRAWTDTLHDPFIISLLGKRAVLDGPVRAWPIPAGGGTDRLVGAGGRVLYAGDAAAAADLFTGEGIGQALSTGVGAGEAIADAAATPAEVATRYVGSVGHSLAAEQRVARVAQSMFTRPFLARGALRATGASRLIGRGVAGWLYESYPREVMLQPRSWPAMFHGQGAYHDN